MIACIAITYFAAEVERREDTRLARIPLALGGQPWEARSVYAFSREVARCGVRAGMSLRMAHILSPEARFLPAVRPKYSCVSSEIMDVLADFSPAMEPRELWHPFTPCGQRCEMDNRLLPARYCLELAGLPLQECLPLVGAIGRSLRAETQFHPAIGLAANKFTAEIAAMRSRPNHLLPVETGVEADFLAGQTVRFLPLEPEAARRLRLLGIRTLGQLAQLPPSELPAQFGAEMQTLQRLAQGKQLAGVVNGRTAPLPLHATRHFDPPLDDRLSLEAVLRRAIAKLVDRLQQDNRAARRLQITWESESGQTTQHTATLREPTADAARLTTSAVELVEQASPEEPIARLRVEVGALEPLQARQLHLWRDTAVSPAAQETLRNLAAKYGACHFLRPLLTNRRHPLPERRFQLEYYTKNDSTLA